MKTYKIEISDDAKNDIKKIIQYIKYELKEPKIAYEHKRAFKEEIAKLKNNAEIYNILPLNLMNGNVVRKINVKNYMFFYRILDNHIVQVIAVFYSKSNWELKIARRTE